MFDNILNILYDDDGIFGEAGQPPSRISAALIGERHGSGKCNIAFVLALPAAPAAGKLIVAGGVTIAAAVGGGAAAHSNKVSAGEEFIEAAEEFREDAEARVAAQFEDSSLAIRSCAIQFVRKEEACENAIEEFFETMTNTPDQAQAIREYYGTGGKIPLGMPRAGGDNWGSRALDGHRDGMRPIDLAAAGNSIDNDYHDDHTALSSGWSGARTVTSGLSFSHMWGYTFNGDFYPDHNPMSTDTEYTENPKLNGQDPSEEIEDLARNGGYFAPYWVYSESADDIIRRGEIDPYEQFYIRTLLNYYLSVLIGQVRVARMMRNAIGGNHGDSIHAGNFKKIIKYAGYEDSYLFSILYYGIFPPTSTGHAEDTSTTNIVGAAAGDSSAINYVVDRDETEEVFSSFEEAWEDLFPYSNWTEDQRETFEESVEGFYNAGNMMDAMYAQNAFSQLVRINVWTGQPFFHNPNGVMYSPEMESYDNSWQLAMLFTDSPGWIYDYIKNLAMKLDDQRGYRMSAIINLVDRIKAEAPGMKESLNCIRDAWAEYEDIFDELEDEWDDLRDEHEVEDFRSMWSGPYDDVTWSQEGITDDLLDDMEDDIIDTAIDVQYRKNPERYFFKEQCYLLTHIFHIAEEKKDEIDNARGGNSPYARFRRMNGGQGRLSGFASNQWTQFVGTTEEAEEAEAQQERDNELMEAIERDPQLGFDSTARAHSKKLLPYLGYTDRHSDDYGPEQYNASLLVDGDPYAFINKMVLSENLGPLVNIKHSTLSLLQPFIRLFKVVFDDEGNEHDVEITFDAYRSQLEKQLFEDRNMRNTGVGLKSFQFTYDGSNPFSAKKSIKAQLKIFANTFDELLVLRGTGDNEYRYVDMAIKSFNTSSERYKDLVRENEEMAKLNFRLKVQVGYSVPSNPGMLKLTREQENRLRVSLYDSIVTLNLTPTVHDFEIDEMGRVNFNIKYLAFVEDALDQAKFNVFSDPYFAVERIKRNLRLEHYRETCESGAVRDIKKAYAVTASEEITEALSGLISTMMDLDRIYYIRLTHDQIKDFVSEGPFADDALSNPPKIADSSDNEAATSEAIEESLETYRDVVREENDSQMGEDEEKAITLSLYAMDPDEQVLSFFYFSDLVDTILRNIDIEMEEIAGQLSALGSGVGYTSDDVRMLVDEYEQYGRIFKKLRYILGPVEFINHNEENESAFVNLGDVPISLKFFLEWLTSTMVKRQDSYFSLSAFMNQFVNDLVRNFLNNSRCFEYNIKQRVRTQQIPFTGPQHPTYRGEASVDGTVKDPVTVACLNVGEARADIHNRDMFPEYPILRDTGLNGIVKINGSDEVNYMIYFIGQTTPSEPPTNTNRKEFDEERGIYHYQIGRERGLVKDIKLKKTSTPGLQEVRFEQRGYDGLEQLRVTYDATIESYANANTFPGTYIYIDPFGFSPSANTVYGEEFNLTKYGIGGYYMIIRSTHQFGIGVANSSIEAKWVNALDDQAEQMSRDAAGAEDRRRDCSSEVLEAQEAADLVPEEEEDSMFGIR